MSQSITLERQGQRVYIVGDTYAVRDRIKALGGHWDGERRAWWVGSKKAAEAESLVTSLANKAAGSATATATTSGTDAPKAAKAKDNPDDIRLTGKGRYKGRVYFAGAITRDGTRVRLLTLPDANGDFLDFWAPCSEVEEVKRYEPREERGAYGRPTDRMVHTTLGSIASFVAREERNRKAGGEVCAACGKSGEMVTDLEDGLRKHPRCCDIEP